MNIAPKDPDEVPDRACTANILLKDNGPCAAPATHMITGPDGRSQWFGCTWHALEANELGCRSVLWPDWYRRNILKEPMSFTEYMESLKG